MVMLPVSWGVQPCINRRCSWSTDGCSSFTAATAAKRDALVVLSANQYGSITLHAVSTAAQLTKPGQEVLQRGGSNPGARSFFLHLHASCASQSGGRESSSVPWLRWSRGGWAAGEGSRGGLERLGNLCCGTGDLGIRAESSNVSERLAALQAPRHPPTAPCPFRQCF